MTTVATNQGGGAVAGARPRLGEIDRTSIAAAAMLGLAFVGVFFRWFLRQHEHSSTAMEDWGHAYLVPLISGYLVWVKREELRRVSPSVFWAGLAPFLLGIMSYFFCLVGIKNHMMQGMSIILTLFGMVLMLLGPVAMRTLFLPIAFLGFGITISERIMIEATFPLKLLASKGAWVMVNVFGAPFGVSSEVEGNNLTVITSSGQMFTHNVAEACSGMRMVIAFFALAAAVALLATKHWWQRVATLMLALPVALLLNIVRVAVLGFASIFNPDLAVGEAHTLIGTLLLIPGLGLFMLVVWALDRVVQEGPAPGAAKGGNGT